MECNLWNSSFIIVCGVSFIGFLFALQESVSIIMHNNITKVTYGKDVFVFTAHTLTTSFLFLVVIILTATTHKLDFLLRRERRLSLIPA